MADTEENPTDPSESRNQQPSQAKPVAPAPRVNPPNVNAAKDAPAAGGPPGFGDFLEWIRSQGGGESASTEAQRSLIPKEKKKFQRRDTDSKADKSAASSESTESTAPPPSPTPEKPSATVVPSRDLPAATAPEAARASEGATTEATDPALPRVRRGQQTVAKRNSWVGLVIQLGVLALLVVAFLLGRTSATKTTNAPAAAPAAPEVVKDGKATTNLLSDANSALIDQAMAAEQASDFKKARELLEKVRDSGEHIHGLAYQIAQLAVFANDSTKAVSLLNDALNDGEELASAYNLRATMAARINPSREASANDYETATKVDPFDARTFFYWGASLRRAGKFQAALIRQRQALDRLREPTAEGLYRLAIRLTLIELGQEKEFADEFGKQLALPYPSIDWLFTAAAIEIRDGKLAAAVPYLTRAEQCGDPDAFSLRIRDYFFYQHRFDKEIKPFIDKLKPAKPGNIPTPPADTPAPADAAPPGIGLQVPTMPPPASPGAVLPH